MSTPFSICATCGVEHQHPLPTVCAICADERQYLPDDGIQRWVTLEELQRDHGIAFWEIEPGLHGLRTTPKVGIGHRPILVQTAEGNLLWEPPGYIDDAAVEQVRSLGGIRWISASHPHMYGVQLAWSSAFDDAPVYVNSRDAEWVARHGDAIQQWDDELKLANGLTLIRLGGHFAGSSIAYVQGKDDKGVLMTGDTILPVQAAGWVTFLRSYPNRVPLSGGTVQRMAKQVLQLDFDRIYGNFDPAITSGAKLAVERSAARHIAWTSGEFDQLT